MTDDIPLKVKRISKFATLPERAYKGDAGLDIAASENYSIDSKQRGIVKTDLMISIPFGYYGRIAPRSGLAVKFGIDVMAGVIDSSYTGEIKVILYNTSSTPFYIKMGDKIAQLIVEKIALPYVVEVNSLEDTKRNQNGFGSTDLDKHKSSINKFNRNNTLFENLHHSIL